MSDQFVWKDEYNMGVEIIDEEHQRLFETINHLSLMTQKKGGWIGGNKGRHACKKGIEYFKEHALQHFADEEDYMARIDYAGQERHKRIHKGFREKTLPALERELEKTGYSPEAIDHFVGVCSGWLIGHTITEDMAIVNDQESLWEDLLKEDELSAIKKATTQFIHNIFCIKSELISDTYNGEKFGKGIYYRLVYEIKNDNKRQEIFLVFEESLLLSTIGEIMGIKSGRINAAMLHSSRHAMQRFAGRIMDFHMKSEPYELAEESLLSYDQFQKAFSEEKRVASMLFNTGEGYFALCILTPGRIQETLGTPIHHDNAVEEVVQYIKIQEEQKKKAPRKKILVVDDSATVRRQVESLLGRDYEVSVVESGVAAIRTVALNKPDLILLDYDMPVFNGKQTLELIRSEIASADIPVIFLTSRNDAAAVKGVLSLSPSGYLLKSMESADIKKRVDGFFANDKQDIK